MTSRLAAGTMESATVYDTRILPARVQGGDRGFDSSGTPRPLPAPGDLPPVKLVVSSVALLPESSTGQRQGIACPLDLEVAVLETVPVGRREQGLGQADARC